MTTAFLILESSTLFATTCASLWKLNEMETVAKRDKHAALAFFFVLAWGSLAIWSFKLSMMTFIAEQQNGLLGVAGTLFILMILSFSARSANLFDATLGKDDHKVDAHTAVDPIPRTAVTDPDNVRSCELRCVFRKDKLDSVRMAVNDTDEYFFTAGG